MRRTLSYGICILACLGLSLVTSGASFAMSPPPHHHHHPVPMHHPGPHHHHHRGSDWVAPLIAGALLVGTLAVAHETQKATAIAQAQTATPSKPSNTLFWCEGEKGYYPQVRACPTGWKAIPQ